MITDVMNRAARIDVVSTMMEQKYASRTNQVID